MTKYTDDQIAQAMHAAAAENTAPPVYALGLGAYKKVINALPEPQDEWQECAFEDIQKGDRVKNVLVRESGQIHTKEGVANRYQGDDSGEGLEWWFMGDYDEYIARSDEPHGGKITVTLYRIPAPVQHPDPAEHPVIIVRDATILNPKQAPLPMMWAEDSYMGGGYHLQPESITSWSPAKVVADND